MNDDHLEELVSTFGELTGRLLHSWEEGHGSHLTPVARLPGGTTGATVVLVIERCRTCEPRKLVIKVCPPEQDGEASTEPGCHLKAQGLHPAYAEEHIVEMVYEPVLTSDGSWILFQAFAGVGPHATPPLLVLVQGVMERWPDRAPLCTAGDLGSMCGRIVRSMLEDWRPPGDEPEVRSILLHEFMGRLLKERDQPGRCIHTWASMHRSDLLDPNALRIELDGESFPNPLALAQRGPRGDDRTVMALTGPSHGDLHPGNIFVPVKRVPIGSRVILPFSTYWLGDLSRFDSDAPLASDPAHFVLSLAALQLPQLSVHEQQALLRYVIDVDDVHSQALLPHWVQLVIFDVMRATPEWIGRSFAIEWREQVLLSLVAWGLIFAGRRTTADALRGWFLRVAAHAARAYLGDAGPGARVVALPPRSGPSADGEPAQGSASGPTDATGPAPGTMLNQARPSPPSGRDGVAGSRVLRTTDRRRELAPHLLRASDQLAEQVHAQWTRAAVGRRLISPQPVRVRWEKSARGGDEVTPFLRRGQVAVDPVVERTEREVAPATDLFPLYCSVGSGTSRLVITGAAGAGKSTAAILLALDVLAYRAQLDHEADRAAVAVPVILTPHDWEPRRQDLVSWMAQRIAADHPLLGSRHRGRKAAEALIRERRIALFLDGLDELSETQRSMAVRALREGPELIVVVLGRPDALHSVAGDAHLASATTVELQPVALEEAVAYLRRCQGDPLPMGWANLLEHVSEEPEGPLARTLDSPLMLGLLRDVYSRDRAIEHQGADEHPRVDELLDVERFPSRDDVEEHLLRQVVPKA